MNTQKSKVLPMLATKYDQLLSFDLNHEASYEKLVSTIESLYKEKIACVISKTKQNIELLLVPQYRVINYQDPFVRKTARTIFPDTHREPYNLFKYDRTRKTPIFYTLDHSWALLSWLSASKAFLEKKITILHFDDHDDLGSPFLDYSHSDFTTAKDYFTARKYDMLNVADLFDAIAYGNIGIGSFILPFVSLCKQPNLIHVKQEAQYINKEKRVLESNSYTSEEFQFRRLFWSSSNNDLSHFSYSRLSIDQLEPITDSDFVIIDIDCDYFCNVNRWDKKPIESNLTIEDLQIKLDNFSERLKEIIIYQKILCITIALSPDFFPSKFWQHTVNQIDKIIDEIHDAPRSCLKK